MIKVTIFLVLVNFVDFGSLSNKTEISDVASELWDYDLCNSLRKGTCSTISDSKMNDNIKVKEEPSDIWDAQQCYQKFTLLGEPIVKSESVMNEEVKIEIKDEPIDGENFDYSLSEFRPMSRNMTLQRPKCSASHETSTKHKETTQRNMTKLCKKLRKVTKQRLSGDIHQRSAKQICSNYEKAGPSKDNLQSKKMQKCTQNVEIAKKTMMKSRCNLENVRKRKHYVEPHHSLKQRCSDLEKAGPSTDNFQVKKPPKRYQFETECISKESQESSLMGKKLFKCHICSHQSYYKSILKHHMITHSTDRNFSCALCSKTYKSKSDLKKHERCHEFRALFSCLVHNKSYNSEIYLAKNAVNSPLKKPDTCKYCEKTFDPIYHSITEENSGIKWYTCDICRKKYAGKHLLVDHINSKHTGIKPYECKFCYKSYSHRRSFDCHLNTHTDKYKCEFCAYRAGSKRDLKLHQAKWCKGVKIQ